MIIVKYVKKVKLKRIEWVWYILEFGIYLKMQVRECLKIPRSCYKTRNNLIECYTILSWQVHFVVKSIIWDYRLPRDFPRGACKWSSGRIHRYLSSTCSDKEAIYFKGCFTTPPSPSSAQINHGEYMTFVEVFVASISLLSI